MESVIPGLIGITLFGGIAAYFAVLAWLAFRSRNWPPVKGVVVSSHVVQRRVVRDGSATTHFRYTPDVRYQYHVDGKRHVGSTICFGRTWNTNEHDAHEAVAGYPVGRAVQVRVQPGRPDRCTLEARASNRVYLFLGISGAMVMSICCGVLWGI